MQQTSTQANISQRSKEKKPEKCRTTLLQKQQCQHTRQYKPLRKQSFNRTPNCQISRKNVITPKITTPDITGNRRLDARNIPPLKLFHYLDTKSSHPDFQTQNQAYCTTPLRKQAWTKRQTMKIEHTTLSINKVKTTRRPKQTSSPNILTPRRNITFSKSLSHDSSLFQESSWKTSLKTKTNQ